MKNLKVGTVVAIPCGENRALCQIVWLSKKIKDCVGLSVLSFDENYQNVTVPLSINIPVGVVRVIYTSMKGIVDGSWPIMTDQHVVFGIDGLLEHNIGGKLYDGDEFLRDLSKDEYNKYPKVLVAGKKAVDIMLNEFIRQNKV